MSVEGRAVVGEGTSHPWSALLEPLTAFWRIVGLTALWLCGCLPIVTAGAATIALFAVTRDNVLDRERPLVRSFVLYLRENLTMGLALFVLVVGPVAALMLLEPWRASPLITLLWLVALLGTVAALPLLIHGFALAAHTHQSLRTLYRASLILAVARPAGSVLSLALIVAVGAATLHWPILLPLLACPAARALFSTFRRDFTAVNAVDSGAMSTMAPAASVQPHERSLGVSR